MPPKLRAAGADDIGHECGSTLAGHFATHEPGPRNLKLLDLACDAPEEFEGRSIVLADREYVVGPRWRDSSQGYAHALRNSVSGLSLHVLQIRREYMSDPEMARSASHQKSRLTSQLRATFARDGGVPVAMLRAFDVCNGTVELHEWKAQDDDADGVLKPARAHAAASRWEEAIQLVNEHLAKRPFDTTALALRGALCVESRDFNTALGSFAEAIRIEPNFFEYDVGRLEAAVRSPSPWAALPLVEDFARRFPGSHDCDELAIHACLRCGKSEQAHELLARAPIREAARQALQPRVMAARTATALFQELSAAWATKGAPANLSARLNAGWEAYPEDPNLTINLALALRSSGEIEKASRLIVSAIGCVDPRYMPQCMANAGYCFASLGQWAFADMYLSAAMSALEMQEVTPGAGDAPGWANWIDPGRGLVVEATTPSAAGVLRPWMGDGGGDPPPSQNVRRLFALLEKAEALYESKGTAEMARVETGRVEEASRSWWRSLFK